MKIMYNIIIKIKIRIKIVAQFVVSVMLQSLCIPVARRRHSGPQLMSS